MRKLKINGLWLTTAQYAKTIGVHPTTIARAIKAGKIKAKRTPGGHYRIKGER